MVTFHQRLARQRRLLRAGRAACVLGAALLLYVAGHALTSDTPGRGWDVVATAAALAVGVLTYRETSRVHRLQLPLAHACQELLEVAAASPRAFRSWSSLLDGKTVTRPPLRRNSCYFSVQTHEDMDRLDDAVRGDRVTSVTTDFKITLRPPAVWRAAQTDDITVTLDSLQYNRPPRRPLRARLQGAALNRRTAVLTPDVTELEQLLKLIRNADTVSP